MPQNNVSSWMQEGSIISQLYTHLINFILHKCRILSLKICAGFPFRKVFWAALTSETKAWHEEPTQESGGTLHFWASAEKLNSVLLPHHNRSHAWDTQALRFSLNTFPPQKTTHFIFVKPQHWSHTRSPLDTQPYKQPHKKHRKIHAWSWTKYFYIYISNQFR